MRLRSHCLAVILTSVFLFSLPSMVVSQEVFFFETTNPDTATVDLDIYQKDFIYEGQVAKQVTFVEVGALTQAKFFNDFTFAIEIKIEGNLVEDWFQTMFSDDPETGYSFNGDVSADNIVLNPGDTISYIVRGSSSVGELHSDEIDPIANYLELTGIDVPVSLEQAIQGLKILSGVTFDPQLTTNEIEMIDQVETELDVINLPDVIFILQSVANLR